MKIYCSSCYKTSEYEITKPKFCSFCGKSMDAAFKSIATINAKVIKSKNIENEDEIESTNMENFHIPIVERLDVVIDLPKRQTLGSFIQNPNNPIPVESLTDVPEINPDKI